MAYIFKEKITYSDYKLFLKNYDYLSFMQEHLWAKAKNYHNYRTYYCSYFDLSNYFTNNFNIRY